MQRPTSAPPARRDTTGSSISRSPVTLGQCTGLPHLEEVNGPRPYLFPAPALLGGQPAPVQIPHASCQSPRTVEPFLRSQLLGGAGPVVVFSCWASPPRSTPASTKAAPQKSEAPETDHGRPRGGSAAPPPRHPHGLAPTCLHRRTGGQPGTSRATREGAIDGCLDMPRQQCHSSRLGHGSPEDAPSVLKFGQSRSARGHLVHVLPMHQNPRCLLRSGTGPYLTPRMPGYAAWTADRNDNTHSPNSPRIRPRGFVQSVNMASDLRN